MTSRSSLRLMDCKTLTSISVVSRSSVSVFFLLVGFVLSSEGVAVVAVEEVSGMLHCR